MFQYALALIRAPKFNLNSAVGASRYLFTRAKRISNTELIMTNNAGIFGAYWSLNHHARVEHTAVNAVCFPFWLDKINPHHDNNHWGQTLLGFPTVVRAIFKQIYPNYPIDKLVTWKMVKELRNFTISELGAMKDRVVLHDLRGESYPVDYSGLFGMSYGDQILLNYNHQTILTVPRDTEVYNWLKIPRQHGLGFLPERTHTELYTLPLKEVPDPILVMGDGLSVVWLQRDFPSHQVIAIVPDKNSELPMIPANSDVDYRKIRKITVDNIISANESEIIIQLVDNPQYKIPTRNCFSAIGYIPHTELTQTIPDNQKTERLYIPEDSWTAPRNIPVGSLTQSLIKFFEETENLEDTFEFQFHHTPSIVEILRLRFGKEFGIELKEVFFDQLRANIAKLDDALDVTEELSLFVRTFKDAQNPSPAELLLFEKAICSIQNEKIIKINKNEPFPKIANNPNIPGKRHFSSLASSTKPQEMFLEKKKALQELVSIFFNPTKEKVQEFDDKHQRKTTRVLTEADRDKMKNVLTEAKKSQKTFSAY